MSNLIIQTMSRRLYLLIENVRGYPARLAKSLWVPREDDMVILTMAIDASYTMGGETFLAADGTLDHQPRTKIGRVYPKGTLGTIGSADENYPVYMPDGVALSHWLTEERIQPISLAKLKRKNSDLTDDDVTDAMPIAELLKRAVHRG